jgi:hypothetical protein
VIEVLVMLDHLPMTDKGYLVFRFVTRHRVMLNALAAVLIIKLGYIGVNTPFMIHPIAMHWSLIFQIPNPAFGHGDAKIKNHTNVAI